uniref:Endonuclease/exonuclease/phosphatase domain-containing protein n=1 Tax=Anopheles atroparvus TaxID=41427 RepID=A0A182JBA9_ANOAO
MQKALSPGAFVRRAASNAVWTRGNDGLSKLTEQLGPNDIIIIVGDFNLPSIVWSTDHATPPFFRPASFTKRDVPFIDGLYLNGLTQLSGICNIHGRQLDLVLGNTPAINACGTIHPAALQLLPEDAHHPALEMCLSVDSPSTARASHPLPPGGPRDLNFRKLDCAKLSRLILEHDWSFLDTDVTIDGATANFTSDLGVWLDDRLAFGAHLDSVVERASRLLGLITRMASEIRDPLCLRALGAPDPRLRERYLVSRWRHGGR